MELKVISYASRVLKDAETRYCARRRELLAIVDFIKHFRVYLCGPHKFTSRKFHTHHITNIECQKNRVYEIRIYLAHIVAGIMLW